MAALATRQHGIVGESQLKEIGMSRRAVERRLAQGRLHLVHREVYSVGYSRLDGRGRWMAAVLAYGDAALLSHRSAASLWGLAARRSHPIDVTAPLGRQGVRRRRGIWIHRGRLHKEDRAQRKGIPVTSVARTLFDLAEVVDFRRLKSAWEEADRLGLLHLRELEAVCDRGYGRRALRPIRRLLAEAAAPPEGRSALEQRFAAMCAERRLPPGQANAVVLGYEVDVLWPAARLIVELDGYAFHRHHAAFERDRMRDAALQAAGYRVIRVTHRRLKDESAALAAQIRACLTSPTDTGA